jgi:hypothetical protein
MSLRLLGRLNHTVGRVSGSKRNYLHWQSSNWAEAQPLVVCVVSCVYCLWCDVCVVCSVVIACCASKYVLISRVAFCCHRCASSFMNLMVSRVVLYHLCRCFVGSSSLSVRSFWYIRWSSHTSGLLFDIVVLFLFANPGAIMSLSADHWCPISACVSLCNSLSNGGVVLTREILLASLPIMRLMFLFVCVSDTRPVAADSRIECL